MKGVLYCFARLFSSEAKETEDAHVGCEGGRGGGGGSDFDPGI